MQTAYTIDAARRLNNIVIVGRLNLHGLFDLLTRLQADEAFEPSYDTIVDYSGVTEIEIQPEDLLAIVAGLQKQDLRLGRCAIITGEQPAVKAYSEVYVDTIRGKLEMEHCVCRNLIEAEIWLGLRSLRG
ncbi:MAG TPA: hypothetical protein VIN57_03570 [Magnetovibrio sp.]